MASLRVPLPPTFLEMPGNPPIKWSQWISQLEAFFYLTDCNLPDEKHLTERQKVAYIRSLLGAEGVRIVAAHPVSSRWETIKYDDFKKELKALFESTTNPVRAEFELRERRQEADESVNDYLTALRTLIADCDLNDNQYENRQLAMQLVIGCRSQQTQEKLLREQNIDLNNCFTIMKADETAQQAAAAIRQEHTVATTATVTTKHNKQTKKEKTKQTKHKSKPDHCFGCGSATHRYKDATCPALGKTCTACGKLNHFAKHCIISQRRQQTKSAPKQSATLTTNTLSAAERKQKLITEISLLHTDGSSLQYDALIDTGSDISTVTKAIFDKFSHDGKYVRTNEHITNFDGSAVNNIIGKFDANVKFSDRAGETTMYITNDTTKCTIGTDLITLLEIDIMGKTLQVSTVTAPSFDEIAAQFPMLTDASQGTFPSFQHTIKLSDDAQPHVTKPRTIPFARLEAVSAECQRMIDDGTWSPIDKSEWVHALVAVPKENGAMRITTDLTALNKYVVPERHQLPNIQELFLQLRGMKYYTKLDLRKGYYHIRLAEESRPLTATMTPIGLMAYNRLTMGLRDSASVFQKAVSLTLADCENCIAFIDDILVHGETKEQHDRALAKVLRRLHERDFRLNLPKCLLRRPEVPFLGHLINEQGVKPDPKNIEPIINTPVPRTLKQVQSYLGAVNYYAAYVPDLATKAEPLRRLTRKNNRFKFDGTCLTAFNEIKEAIANGLQLAIFDFNADTIVTVDSSDYGLGAHMTQIQNGKEVTIAFASRTLSAAERNYATNEREGLSAIWACEHWEKFLLGRPFKLRTDHASLTSLLTKHTSKRKSAKFARWLEGLSAFEYTVSHIRGEDNVISDFLSRLPLDNQTMAIDDDDEELTINALTKEAGISIDIIQDETERDETLNTIYKHVYNSDWPHKNAIKQAVMPYYKLRDELSTQNRIIMRDNRFVVPSSMQARIMTIAHEGHPGIVRMKRQLRQHYWWPGMDKQIEHFVKKCVPCNDSEKSHKPTKQAHQHTPVPDKPWTKVAIDITGPFANAPQHQRFIVVLIDYTTAFPEALLTGDITSHRIIKWLKTIFGRFGNPSVLVSDNGPSFKSDEFSQFLKSRDILHHPVPVYNPERNGKVEAFNRYLKYGIQTFEAAHTKFDEGIEELLFSYRATPLTPTGDSPAKKLLGHDIRTNYQPNTHVLTPVAQSPSCETQPTPSQQAPLPLQRGPYSVGDLVRKRKQFVPKGTSPFTSPFKVTEVLGQYTYRLDDGQVWNVKNLVKYVRPQRRQEVAIELDAPCEPGPLTAAPRPPRRQSARQNKGVLPRRYRE